MDSGQCFERVVMRGRILGLIVLCFMGCAAEGHPLIGKKIEIHSGDETLGCKELSQIKRLALAAQQVAAAMDGGDMPSAAMLALPGELRAAGQARTIKATETAIVKEVTPLETVGEIQLQYLRLDNGYWIPHRSDKPSFDVVN
jgi:hypothetical protein